MTTDIQHVGLLGLGTMGAGIAQLVAQSGREVTVLETDRARIDAGTDFLRRFLDTGVARGKLTESRRDGILGRVRGVTDPAALAGTELVIEAVTEKREVKRELLAAVAEAVGPDALLVTNTSALSVTDLATAVPHPGRFAGLHFFNPAPLMKVIEVVQALQTEERAVERLVGFVEALGKNAVVVRDRPGFLVNRLLIPYLNDVVQAYDDGLASAEDIDTAVRLGLGHKQGPLELMDMIGLDVHEHATTRAYEATLDPVFAPPPLLRQMVAAGRLGNKSGSGFRTEKN
ncbi:3-hydroxyacyl-CoA dehydrogenase family protein [Streptomyces anthocyanicus]|uniref:3-hydroxyacyl-CoA dehydrogenase family protein n=1 Tax=Streptomyces anthocyanicus TaxID=68174 RepID=UPI003807A624